MNADLTLLVVVMGLTSLFVLRRTHVSLTTMALCGGYALSDRASLALTQQADGYIDSADVPLYTIVKLLLLFGPPLFVAFHFRDTQKGSGRLLEQLVPAFSLSLLLVVFVLEQIPFEARNEYLDISVALNQLWVYSPWVVLFAFMTAMFDVLMHKPDEAKKKANSKKKKR